MTDPEFLSKLKKLCLEFDAKAGTYPDHEYPGFALYLFAKNPAVRVDSYNIIDPEHEEGGKEYLEELEILEGD